MNPVFCTFGNFFPKVEDSVLLTKKYLEGQLGNGALPRRPHVRKDQPIGAKEIAKFLSKNEKQSATKQYSAFGLGFTTKLAIKPFHRNL